MLVGKIDREVGFVQAALNARAMRQEVLAANIANADTPNYKARDVDFAAALAAAKGAGGLDLARTSARHLAGAGAASLGNGVVKYRGAAQPSLDGNTVDIDVERAAFAENAMHYQFLLERARSTFSRMASALESSR
jgi:flagellar basal-body rod protein FlgB